MRLSCFALLLCVFTRSDGYSLNETSSLDDTLPYMYSLMIDAGSKGSRLFVFRWKPSLKSVPPWEDRSLVVPELVAKKSVHPGMGWSALKPETVLPPLVSLLDFAKERLASLERFWKYFPIYLMATAGMRDVVPARRDLLMGLVTDTLKSSPFYFHSRFAKVISGEEEAAFAWLTLNANRASLSHHGEESFGSLDMGGASFQIAFVPVHTHYVLQDFYSIVLDRSEELRLYAKSYLHYGMIEASRRVAAFVIGDALLKVDSTKTIYNPCVSRGLNYSPDFATEEFNFPLRVTLTGSGDFPACQVLVKRLMDKHTRCWVTECTFDGEYQPRLNDRPFVAQSNFAKVVSLLGLPANSAPIDIYDRASWVCSLSVAELQEELPHLSEDQRETLCFGATYVYTLLTYGLGFAPSTRQIEFRKKEEDGRPFDWALGAMVFQVNNLPPSSIPSFYKEALSNQTLAELLDLPGAPPVEWAEEEADEPHLMRTPQEELQEGGREYM